MSAMSLTIPANVSILDGAAAKSVAGIGVPSELRRSTAPRLYRERGFLMAGRIGAPCVRRSLSDGNANPVLPGHLKLAFRHRVLIELRIKPMSALVSHQYESIQISQRPNDGYLHATAMCKAVGKLFADYRRLDTTKAYLTALSADMGIPITKLINSLKGGNGTQGTWVHPKVAIHLAQWLSPKFAVWCTNIIHDWMEGKRVVVKEHRRKAPARKLPDPCTFASNIPVADLLYSAQGHLNDALRTKNATKAEWHTKVAAGCVGAMLDNMSETGLHVLHRQLASQQETIKQMKGKA